MQVLDRLKLELSNQQYFSDGEYIQFLMENNLKPTDTYVKADMQKNLLLTVIDILEAVANDIDVMHSISTEFADIGQAYQFIEVRISQVKDKIASIPEPDENYSCFSLMYTNGRSNDNTRKLSVISNDTIDEWFNE
nr:MAG TPA: hypothetical protein [Caudoviricetes sp.]